MATAAARPSAAFMGIWPTLDDIGLTDGQRTARAHGIGGSDANTILSGDEARILHLWQEKRGEVEPDNLDHILPVMMGCWTEPFNRLWYMRETGLEVINDGKSMACPKNPWRLCTLDGQVPARGMAVWEAKHTAAFSKPEEILTRYAPQLQHNMAVCGVDLAILSVFYGNHKWEIYEVAADWLYQEELLEAERKFWNAIQTGDCPVAAPVPAAPKPLATREIDMSGSNSWSANAADWLANATAAKVHATATKELKALVEDDVSRAYGAGIEIKRSKAGALTIKEAN